jgi:hypothetical protein
MVARAGGPSRRLTRPGGGDRGHRRGPVAASSRDALGLQHLGECTFRRRKSVPSPGSAPTSSAAVIRKPRRPWQWLGQNQDLAQLIVIQRKRDHRSAKLRAPFLIGYSGRTEVKAAEVLGLYKIQNASRDFFALPSRETSLRCQYVPPSIAWLTQQLRQLGGVRRHAPRLVARQPIWSPSRATYQYVRNRGRSGSARLAFEMTLMTQSGPRRGFTTVRLTVAPRR